MVSLAQFEPRECMLRVRCTATEYRRWQALAASYDCTLSGLVRRHLDGVQALPRRRIPKADPELIRQIALVGNNMNQIARAVNAAQVAGSRASAVDILSELASIERQLRQLVGEASER